MLIPRFPQSSPSSFWHAQLWLVSAVAVGLCVPLFQVDWPATHENIAYVIRTVEWASELRAGHLFPDWCPDFYGGYGSSFLVFHGPVVYAIAGFLSATFLDPATALKLVVVLGSLAAGLGTYALVHGETRSRDASLLAAIAYLAAPYRLGNLYDRGDINEFTCIALLPIVIFLYRAAAHEPRPRRALRLGVWAVIAHASMIAAHAVMGLWGTLVVGLIVIITACQLWRRRLRRRALLLAALLACAPALAGVYVVPALVYKSITHTAAMVLGFYEARYNYTTLEVLFANSHPIFGHNFLKMGPFIGVCLTVCVLGMVAHFRRGRAAFGYAALALLFTALTLPQFSAFWQPNRLPFVVFIQFPWRLLGPAGLLAAIALGIAVAAIGDRFGTRLETLLSIAGSALFLLWIAWPAVVAIETGKSNVPREPESIRQGMYSATGVDEYLPLRASGPPSAPRAAPVLRLEHATLDSARVDSSRHFLVLHTDRPGASVDLALYWFPGWKVTTIEGPKDVRVEQSEHGLVALKFPAVGHYSVRVSRGFSPAFLAGGALSLAVASLLGALLVLQSRPLTLRRRRHIDSLPTSPEAT
jgi:6-pyruvoyl-tetrahydropterin synthase-like protein